jgi:FtsZ-binding cell division protein ZapB
MERELRRAIEDAIAFLQMAAIELRRMAQSAPNLATQLGQVADKLDAEANHLSRRIAG